MSDPYHALIHLVCKDLKFRMSYNQWLSTLFSQVCVFVFEWVNVCVPEGASGPLTCSSSVTLKRSDKPKISASSLHINSTQNVLIQSSLYFMLPRAIEKELLPVVWSRAPGPEAIAGI